jgi:phosphatidylserine decarboxylase
MKLSEAAWVQRLLPQRLLSRSVYHLARCRWRWLKDALILWFARHYGVDLEEAASADTGSYPCFNEFFARGLKPGARPLEGDESTVVSPVDGRVAEFGALDGERLLQAKGMPYSLAALLGERSPPGTFGTFATFYLAPHNYHRVHMPLAGTLRHTRYIPGARYSVSPAISAVIPGLLARNERVVCWFDTVCGPLALVLVGALNVSSISTSWLGTIASGKPRAWQTVGGPEHYARGVEIGRFNLGSTVVVVLPGEVVRWRADLRAGGAVKMGNRIATLLEREKVEA